MKCLTFVCLTTVCFFHAFGQSSWDKMDFKSEDSYCFKLKERENPNALDIDSELRRFREEPIDKLPGKEVFRIVSKSGTLGDISHFSIIRFERIDSLCTITLKVVDNIKRNEIFVHTKTYGLSTWEKFNSLADTTFWDQPKEIPMKTFILDGLGKSYEFNSMGKFHVLLRGSNTGSGKERMLEEQLWKLLNPVFGINCKEDMR